MAEHPDWHEEQKIIYAVIMRRPDVTRQVWKFYDGPSFDEGCSEEQFVELAATLVAAVHFLFTEAARADASVEDPQGQPPRRLPEFPAG